MDKKTVLIASDHNGNELRDFLIPVIRAEGHVTVDMGPRTDKNLLSIRKVDYTEYGEQLAYAVTKDPESLCGVLICGTGVGMSIIANRFEGVRASLVSDVNVAMKTREHNDSNVLVLGSWRVTKTEAADIFKAWSREEFGKGRHQKRDDRITRHDKDDVVLVPGVFDLIQGAHVHLFRFAATMGRVVVALNSDQSASDVKKKRPVQNQNTRKLVLDCFDFIDEVIIMDDRNAERLLHETGAKYIVKGAGVTEESVRVSDHVPDGVQIKIFPKDWSHSSEKIREALSNG